MASHEKRTLLAILVLSASVLVLCDDADLTLPTDACKTDHFQRWRNSVNTNGIEVASHLKLSFDETQLDEGFVLYQEADGADDEPGYIHLDLYKTEPGFKIESDRPTSSETDDDVGDDVYLTEEDIAAAFLEKEERGKMLLLNKRDIRNAFDAKRGFYDPYPRAVKVTQGQRGLTEGDVDAIFVQKEKQKEPLLEKRDLAEALEKKGRERQKAEAEAGSEDVPVSGGGVALALAVPTYDQRPKLYVSHESKSFFWRRQRVTLEYAFKSMAVRLPKDLYKQDNTLPIHAKVTLFFTRYNAEENGFTIEYPIYGAYEDGIEADAITGQFLMDLSKVHPKSIGNSIYRDLRTLKPALHSVTGNNVPVYHDGEKRKFVALASCEFVQEDILQDLFYAHRMDLLSYTPNEDVNPHILTPLMETTTTYRYRK